MNVTLTIDGTVFDCVPRGAPVVPPVVVPPVVTPPPSGNFVGPDMWNYLTHRRDVHLTLANPVSEGYFIVPPEYSSVIELEVSGAEIQMRLDGEFVSSDARRLSAGPHTYDAVLASGAQEAMGSIAVAHS